MTVEFKKPNRQRSPAPVPPRSAPAVLRPVPLQASPATPEKARPRFKPKVLLNKLPSNKKTALFTVIGCLAVGVIGWGIVSSSSNAATKKPTYQTVLPKGKTINELGGWKRVSPPNDQPVFAFTDAIDGVPVSVTEQPLPQSFKANADSQVAELAKKFNATDKIDASGTDVYVGTSAKGPQSVIFTSGDLLILIKSEKKVSNASWAKYAASLVK